MNLKITYKAEDQPLDEALEGMFKKNGLGYLVVSKPGNAYDGTVLIKQGRERGYAAGEEPDKTAEKEPVKEKTAAKEKEPAKEKEAAKEKTPPPEDGDKSELIAASKLKLAKQLADDGKLDKAKPRYEEIIKQYPKTKAADEARELLKKATK